MTDVITPEPALWDAFVEKQGGHLLQLAGWGDLKAGFGWSAEPIALADDGSIHAGALMLFRRLPAGAGTIAYVPRGPLADWGDAALLRRVVDALVAVARRHRAVVLKLEPDLWDDDRSREILRGLGFTESFQVVQPPRTIVIVLTGSEDDILARMNQGTRRKIRTAEKKGVMIREGTLADLPSFASLMRVTGARNEFGVHSAAYYQRAFDLFAPLGRAALLLASYEGKDLAGIMVFRHGNRAWYFYGASSGEERDRMPAYGLQWAAIRWARAHGCREYDLWGVPDANPETLEEHFQSRDDGLWGVYGFKRGFGGDVRRAVGAWDLPLRPLLYSLYRVAYRLRP